MEGAEAVKEAVDDGRIVWISVLDQNGNGAVPSQEDVEEWALEFDHPLIPVLGADDEHTFGKAADLLGGSPTAIVLDAHDMRLLTSDNSFALIDWLAEEL